MCTSLPNPEEPASRCQMHPEIDPQDQHYSLQNSACEVCRNLYHGARHIGAFDGEFTAVKHDSQYAKISIGPLSLRQFGLVRHQLAWNHQYGGPIWHTCKDTMTIYLYHQLSKPTVKLFSQAQCTMHEKIFIEPKLELEKFNVDTGNCTIRVSLPFGNQEISLMLRAGMTPSEFREILKQLIAQTLTIPSEQYVLCPIR